jgi:hypothetical protein
MAICKNYDECLAVLRAGERVYGDRGSGKTSALLQFVYEQGDVADATIIVVNSNMVAFTEREWKDRFPGSQVPRFVSVTNRDGLRGRSGAIYRRIMGPVGANGSARSYVVEQ